MLRAEGLTKRFGALTAVEDVSFEVRAGERLGLIGPNGAGKSTLFALLAGALPASAGAVFLDGENVARRSAAERARRGLARSFQKNALFEPLSVAETFAVAHLAQSGAAARFWPRSAPRDLDRQVSAAARRAGLEPLLEAPVASLSYGAKRQLEIGLALIGAPKALLLDEPAAGVGPEERQAMRRLIADAPRDAALIVVEHDMDFVFDLCERLLVLSAGRVVFDGPAEAAKTSAAVQEAYLGAPDPTSAAAVEPPRSAP